MLCWACEASLELDSMDLPAAPSTPPRVLLRAPWRRGTIVTVPNPPPPTHTLMGHPADPRTSSPSSYRLSPDHPSISTAGEGVWECQGRRPMAKARAGNHAETRGRN